MEKLLLYLYNKCLKYNILHKGGNAMNIMALLKQVIKARIERRKQLSYWLAKSFKLAFLYIFKDEVLEFAKFAIVWARANIKFSAIFQAITFIGFAIATILVVYALLSIYVNGESIETLPEKIESILKKLESLLETKVADL